MTPSPFTGEALDGQARGDGIQSFGGTWQVVAADASSGVAAPVAAPIAPHPVSLPGRVVRAVQAGPLAARTAVLVRRAAPAGTRHFGLRPAGWIVGVACGVATYAALAYGLSRLPADRLGPANWVTLARATLAGAVAALIADSFARPEPVTLLVALTALALALDAVDGWVARRTRTTGTLGAHFDAEVDAFLILILSVYVGRSIGAWVLAIGAARYVFLAAGWPLPWMRAQLPPRYWRKFVAATQGIVLAVVAAGVLPRTVNQAVLVASLALLAESFGHDLWWLWNRRHGTQLLAAADDPGRRRVRRTVGAALT